MKKIFTLFHLSILLIMSNLVFSQVENPYLDFSPLELKNKKDYVKNFNPGTYDSRILYACMSDMIDLLRKEYAFLEPMKHDINIDSVAQMQADFQANKDEKTDINVAPYKTTYYRLKKFGLTYNGIELVSKAKASMGTQDYSYYDLCFELLKPLLKNPKLAVQLVDKHYTYLGFGYQTDEFMKSVYCSFILGNDRIFNPDKPAPSVKILPFTKGKAGLQYYDSKICAKCNDDNNLEVLSSYIQVKNEEVRLVCDDHKFLKRLIGKEGDAIVLDFVQKSQYDCSGNVIDNDKPFRGFVSKPITYLQLLEDNTIADKKSTKLSSLICTIPEEIETESPFDINVIVLKEGKYVCRTIIKKEIEFKNADYNEKMNFLKDETSVKPAGEWVAADEISTVSFKIPFTNAKKMEFKLTDFDTLITQLPVPTYTVNKIDLIVHNSLNYANDPTQIKNQKKRAESISKALQSRFPGIVVTISYDDSWKEFQKDVVNDGNYYDLTFEKPEAIKQMKSNPQIAKDLEHYLVNHRFADVVMEVTYSVSGDNEAPYTVWKFNEAIKSGKKNLAMSIENYMIKQVENKNYSLDIVNQMVIPEKKSYQALLNNKLYMQFYLTSKINEKMTHSMDKVFNMEITNQICNFNKTMCEVLNAKFASIEDINKIQLTLDKFYTIPNFPKDKVNSLNLELQFKIIDYIGTIPSTPESALLLTATFDKIKAIKNKKLDSWQNAYKLAAVFAKNNDYVYALSLMDPFVNESTISEDFIFSYISLAAHREETYMSSLLVKMVRIASDKNPVRLCALFDKLPACVFDNASVKAIVCKACNK